MTPRELRIPDCSAYLLVPSIVFVILKKRQLYCYYPDEDCCYHNDCCDPSWCVKPTPVPTAAPTPSPSTGNGGGNILSGISCFSEKATVDVRGKGSVAMGYLRVGDFVLTGSDGTYEPIYAFGHSNPKTVVQFVQIHIRDSRILEVTGDHLIYVKDKSNPIRADSIRVGDVLVSSMGDNNTQAMAVTKIAQIQRRGIYAPLTTCGTLMVDGVKASVYASFQSNHPEFVQLGNGSSGFLSHHDYAHMGLSPLRLACQGIYPQFFSSIDNDGMPLYVKVAIDLNVWMLHQSTFLRALILLAIILVTGTCFFLENVVGTSVVPLVTVIVGATLSITMRKGNHIYPPPTKMKQ